MHIPNELQQFRNKNALLLAAGKQTAVAYRIEGDDIRELFTITAPHEEYADNEGIFQAAPNGRHVSGAIEVRQDEEDLKNLLDELEPKYKEIADDFDELYFFAPDMSTNRIKESLPKSWQEKITHEERGEYVKLSPLELLGMIARAYEKSFEPVTNEEKKILSIPKQ